MNIKNQLLTVENSIIRNYRRIIVAFERFTGIPRASAEAFSINFSEFEFRRLDFFPIVFFPKPFRFFISQVNNTSESVFCRTYGPAAPVKIYLFIDDMVIIFDRFHVFVHDHRIVKELNNLFRLFLSSPYAGGKK